MSIFMTEIRLKMEVNKKCEVCGRLLPESEFSKSYKHRCKRCVAKMTKEKRDNAKYGRVDRIFDEYLSKKPRPKREVITITVDHEKGCWVDYQRDDEPKKNWKDCDTQELISINAAADVLKAGTEITTRLGKIVGDLHELEKLFGIKIEREQK